LSNDGDPPEAKASVAATTIRSRLRCASARSPVACCAMPATPPPPTPNRGGLRIGYRSTSGDLPGYEFGRSSLPTALITVGTSVFAPTDPAGPLRKAHDVAATVAFLASPAHRPGDHCLRWLRAPRLTHHRIATQRRHTTR